ncbi:FKBP-type peptidyl-prolyl cis-trans isomerase [Corallococcus sp. ZKHCc1 1396]|uniref:Peptidyl-prolyl cis-trans isomerase n=1 Tax=Corallococcus soli TaxID=2710757 RepID=A0ABR9PG45_9BACT|nr:FKBP-type peptidyl-prolyl cis-trans isomerase [Corallococcus soli]MBE4746885.1 FKBP-type peptidyl-prolyl cis-trans isomerase [Corallococcus soli]
MIRPLLLCAVLALAGCGDSSGDPAKETYADALGVDLAAMNKSDSGLYTQDLTVGDGAEASPGKVVQVHYSGWLPDGTLFDSSIPRGTPISLVLAKGRVIDGWVEGVSGMRAGGKRKLVIPSDMGYGSEGSPPAIPSNAVLVFDVQLLNTY